MRILLTMNLPMTRKYGGANKSNRILAQELARNGCTVIAVTPALAVPSDVTHEQLAEGLEADGIHVSRKPGKFIFSLDGVEVHAALEADSLYSNLREQIREFKPDWIFVSTEDTSHILLKTVYDESPDNIIYLAHTHYMLPFGRLSFYPGKKRTELIGKARSIITISQYMADYISDCGFPTFVNHPPHFDTDDVEYVAARTNKYVLLNNPCAVKGIDILLGLAEALPQVQFAVVPGWGTTPADTERLKAHANITFLKSTSDLNSLFRNASLLLMPSIWEEGFGMTAIDAMLRGVPVIASNHGGLAEAKLGTNYQFPVNPIPEFKDELDENKFPVAVIPPQDIAPWKNAIETLLSDEELYRQESIVSRDRAKAFTDSLSVKPLIEHLRSLGGEKSTAQQRKEMLDKLQPEQKARLMERIRQKRAAEAERLETIRPAEKKQYYPVSFSQKQTLIVDEMNKGYYGSIIGTIVEQDGQVDAKILGKALNAVCRRHESFRTRFVKVDGEFMQEILGEINFQLEEIVLDDPSAYEQSINDQVQEVLTGRFDLSQAPLLRFRLIRCAGKNFLLYAMHHIISDGISLHNFIREVTTLYRAFSENKPDPLPSLRIQYKDYTEWQNKRIANGGLAAARSYWLNLLSGELPVLNLPLDFPRPAVKTYNGDSVLFTIAEKEVLALDQLGREQGASLFITLLSVVNVLLYRYTGQDDIIVGTPVAGRKSPELQEQIGYYVNMVALRNKVNGKGSFTELLNSVKNVCLRAYEYDEYPFDKLIEELVDKRDISRSPVFDIMVSMSHGETEAQPQEEQAHQQTLAGHLVSEVKSGSSHDMAFLFYKEGGKVHVTFTYNTDLFRKERISRMSGHFTRLVQSFINDRESAVNDAEMLSSEERRELLYGFNPPECGYPSALKIQEQFEKIAAEFPDNIAVEHNDTQLTYADLNRQANRVAHELRSRQLARGEIVAVLGERSPEMIVALLGILKAGGCYLPLDPDFPAERINFAIADSGCRIVLVPESLKRSAGITASETFWADEAFLQERNPENPDCINQAQDAAYIIYTSGSTGKPKGAIIQHNNVIRLFFNDRPLFDFSAHDTWTLFHSFSFDFSVWEMYGALLFGGRVVIVPRLVAQEPAAFLQLLSNKKVTVLNQVPGAFYSLTDHLIAGSVPLHLRYIIFGGDMLHPARLKSWKSRYPDTRLINMFGITETTVHVTYKEITAQEIEKGVSNIGKPIPTLQVYILDENLQLLPAGAWGELCVSGAGVARGYLNAPSLTAEKFIENPFAKGERMYRSGDLGRYLPNGDIEYLGRKDHQVQLRGYRIELQEIEHQVKTHPLVSDAAIVVHQDNAGEPFIAAYLVLNENDQSFADHLRKHLQQKLPRYMVPSFFIPVDKIPLTANGKIDRKALPLPQSLQGKNKKIDPPANDTEALLLEIWKEVLETDAIGVNDDFFELGGHSIKAVKVTAQIHRQLNVMIRLGDFFENPTVRQLAEVILLVSGKNAPGTMSNEVEVIL